MFDGCLRFYLTTSGLSFLCFCVTYVLYLNSFCSFGVFFHLILKVNVAQLRIDSTAKREYMFALHSVPDEHDVYLCK